ncbi:MAG: hypothetical protein DRI23_06115 [Candidatus Cloacimonadota bacterium]|nr:MAG: hypothetical protein DRI23_06115 [Candidatus Cloacimonadota bacterium]
MNFENNNFFFSKEIPASGEIGLNRKDSCKQFIDEPFLDALDEWVWEMDLDGIHTYSNSAVEKVLGYQVEEVVGFPTQKLWNQINKNVSTEAFKESLASGKGWKNFPAYFVHKDGTIKILLSSAVPIYDENDVLKGYRGIDRDITERVMNENFLKSQKEHIKLINQVLRHDISNDLTVINSCIRLYEQLDDAKYLTEIKTRLRKSLNLIQNMKRHEAFVLDNADLKVFSVQHVISGIIRNIKEAEFTINGDSHFLADEIIYSVFENIINNAINHGKADKIGIDIHKENFKCTITISDNGIGIPDEVKDKLFDEEYKYGPSANTGMGLFIVKQAMERYKGDISVENNTPRGTIFKLVFHRLET